MKKLLLLLLLAPVIGFGQEETTQNINLSVKSGYVNQMSQGIYDNKDGTLTVVEVGGTGFVSLNKLRKRADKSILKYADNNNFSYKYLSETTRKTTVGVFPKVSRVYKIFNLDGSPIITKSTAISKIKEFKELLDMGVISKEEFNDATKKYKEELLKD